MTRISCSARRAEGGVFLRQPYRTRPESSWVDRAADPPDNLRLVQSSFTDPAIYNVWKQLSAILNPHEGMRLSRFAAP
jgi:hypothetical protein